MTAQDAEEFKEIILKLVENSDPETITKITKFIDATNETIEAKQNKISEQQSVIEQVTDDYRAQKQAITDLVFRIIDLNTPEILKLYEFKELKARLGIHA